MAELNPEDTVGMAQEQCTYCEYQKAASHNACLYYSLRRGYAAGLMDKVWDVHIGCYLIRGLQLFQKEFCRPDNFVVVE